MDKKPSRQCRSEVEYLQAAKRRCAALLTRRARALPGVLLESARPSLWLRHHFWKTTVTAAAAGGYLGYHLSNHKKQPSTPAARSATEKSTCCETVRPNKRSPSHRGVFHTVLSVVLGVGKVAFRTLMLTAFTPTVGEPGASMASGAHTGGGVSSFDNGH